MQVGTTGRTSITRQLRRIVTAVAGFGVLAVGLALLAVPVPGTSIVVIPLGLAILAREFSWAGRLLASSTGLIRRASALIRRAVCGSSTVVGGRPCALPNWGVGLMTFGAVRGARAEHLPA